MNFFIFLIIYGTVSHVTAGQPITDRTDIRNHQKRSPVSGVREQRYIINRSKNIVENIDMKDMIVIDELQILKMIPKIIDQMKKNRIADHEQKELATVFGDLWQLIIEESIRSPTTEINPVLKALLQSRELKQSKRKRRVKGRGKVGDKRKRSRNDRAMKKRLLKSLKSNDIDNKESFSQRLLKLAAKLIHETLSKQRSHNRRSPTRMITKFHPTDGDRSINTIALNLELNDHDNRIRVKRSSNDLVDPMKRLNELIADNDKSSDYLDSLSSERLDQNPDYSDYAFDMTNTGPNENDDDVLRRLYGFRSANEDYENGSVSELLKIAAKHEVKRNSRMTNGTGEQTTTEHSIDYVNDESDEYYYDYEDIDE